MSAAEDRDALIAAAEIGEQGRLFLNGELGRCLIGLAQQDAQQALDSLGKVSPTDENAIRNLQGDYRNAMRFEEYLLGLVSDGESAIAAFRQQQQE